MCVNVITYIYEVITMIQRFVVATIVLASLSSCTPSEPYEIKSPCVSGETDNPFAINPCVRRPVNLLHDIG